MPGVCCLQSVPEGVVIEALLIDNRGMGKSSCPKSKKCYSTKRMAMDALAIMVSVDHPHNRFGSIGFVSEAGQGGHACGSACSHVPLQVNFSH